MVATRIQSISAALVALFLLGGLAGRSAQAAEYPYSSDRFRQLVEDSYGVAGKGRAGEFFAWMRQAYVSSSARPSGKEFSSLEGFLRAKRGERAAISNPAKRAQYELALGAWLHKFVKAAIPRFSLERGYEFYNVVDRGERQCLLQAVLIAALLQEMGADAGVVMIYKNIKGEESNNGHVATLLRLSDGAHLILDASDPVPYVSHQGLLARAPNYTYLRPIYRVGTNRISRYQAVQGKTSLSTARVSGLDFSYVRSQFWYYRGERAPGGILAAHKTPAGLRLSEKHLRRAVETCRANPLAVYMLGRTLLEEGKPQAARGILQSAATLYTSYGWMPPGPGRYLALAQRAASRGR